MKIFPFFYTSGVVGNVKPYLWDTLRLEIRDRREMAAYTGARMPDTQGNRGPAPDPPSTPQSASREERSSTQP